jgi:uncharacterized protein YndB with AHSA1/START domain
MSGPEDMGSEYGTLERLAGSSILRFRRRLLHPREKVWSAMTDDAHLAAWFPTTIEGERVVGAPLRFSFRDAEAEPFVGEMLAFVPPSLMELRWADDVLRFELEPDGPGCVLYLTVTFPEYGKAARDAAGWHVCLEQLEAASDGTDLPWQPPDRWRVVNRGYVERFGPEASTIGPPEEWEREHGANASD